jgi:hypothetical protein
MSSLFERNDECDEMKQIICNKIDKRKIRKIKDIHSEKEWIEAVFIQFGIKDIEELEVKAKEFGDQWYEHFYWSQQTEDEWERLTLKQFEPMVRKLIKRGMWVMILNWFPTSMKMEWDDDGKRINDID